MASESKKRTQVSVSLGEEEKNVLAKQSFRQNRSISQIMRFAIKKYLDGLDNAYMKPIEEESVEQIFLNLGSQLAKNADILYALKAILVEMELKQDRYSISYLSDNATAISGYDKYDLLDPVFFESRMQKVEDIEKLFHPKGNLTSWEHKFKFKKPNGEFSDTRLSFTKTENERLLGIWQFILS